MFAANEFGLYKVLLGRSRKDPHLPHGGNDPPPFGQAMSPFPLPPLPRGVHIFSPPPPPPPDIANFLHGESADLFWNDPFIYTGIYIYFVFVLFC